MQISLGFKNQKGQPETEDSGFTRSTTPDEQL